VGALLPTETKIEAMPAGNLKQDDTLTDFVRREITLNNTTKRVYAAGSVRRQIELDP
jgi:hypothetical protein